MGNISNNMVNGCRYLVAYGKACMNYFELEQTVMSHLVGC